MGSRVLTIMITDIKGYSEKTSSSSRKDLVSLLEKHDKLLRPIIDKFKGNVVKTIGDAFLITFDSPTNAVLCGCMMQETLREYNEERKEEKQIIIRVAINTGEVELKDDDVFGDAVNIAARLEGITEPNEIYFTEAVYLSMNKSEVPSAEVGHRLLKGVPEEVKVYRVHRDRTHDGYQKLITRLKSGDAFVKEEKKSSKGLLILILIAALAGGGWFMFRDTPEKRMPPIEKALAERDFDMAMDLAKALKNKYPESKLAVSTIKRIYLTMVDDAVKRGEPDLAIRRADEMLERFANSSDAVNAVKKAIDFEASAATSKHRYKDALQQLEMRKEERPQLNFDEVWRKIMLKKIEFWVNVEKKPYRHEAAGSYDSLFKVFPDDDELHKHRLNFFGENSKHPNRREAWRSALYFAEKSTGNVNKLIGETLLENCIYGGIWGDENRSKIWSILKDRYPDAGKSIRRYLVDKDKGKREMALRFLKETGVVTDQDMIEFHFTTLCQLNFGSYGEEGQATLDYLKGIKEGLEWKKKKESCRLELPEKIQGIEYNNEFLEKITDSFSRLFFDEIKPRLQSMLQENSEELKRVQLRKRYFAYKIMLDNKIFEDQELWDFHYMNLTKAEASHLDAFDLLYKAAYAYFGKYNGTEKEDKAREALMLGNRRMDWLLEKASKYKYEATIKLLKEHKKLSDKAFKSFKKKY